MELSLANTKESFFINGRFAMKTVCNIGFLICNAFPERHVESRQYIVLCHYCLDDGVAIAERER